MTRSQTLANHNSVMHAGVLCACWYVLCLGGGGIGMIVLASLIWGKFTT